MLLHQLSTSLHSPQCTAVCQSPEPEPESWLWFNLVHSGDTRLSLVETDHVTWILGPDWSAQSGPRSGPRMPPSCLAETHTASKSVSLSLVSSQPAFPAAALVSIYEHQGRHRWKTKTPQTRNYASKYMMHTKYQY